jgi:hypothetical protein
MCEKMHLLTFRRLVAYRRALRTTQCCNEPQSAPIRLSVQSTTTKRKRKQKQKTNLLVRTVCAIRARRADSDAATPSSEETAVVRSTPKTEEYDVVAVNVCRVRVVVVLLHIELIAIRVLQQPVKIVHCIVNTTRELQQTLSPLLVPLRQSIHVDCSLAPKQNSNRY